MLPKGKWLYLLEFGWILKHQLAEAPLLGPFNFDKERMKERKEERTYIGKFTALL